MILVRGESNGDVDHVHMLIEYHQQCSFRYWLTHAESCDIRRLRNEFDIDLREHTEEAALWSRSCCWLVRRLRRWKL